MVTINKNVSFKNHASGIQFSDCSKLAVNWKNNNDVTMFANITSSSILFDVTVFLLSNIVTGIITDSRVMTIFPYRKLTRNSEIGNNPVK